MKMSLPATAVNPLTRDHADGSNGRRVRLQKADERKYIACGSVPDIACDHINFVDAAASCHGDTVL